MPKPARDTRYAKELASAKLRSGSKGKSFAAIERIFVKQAKQEEIRFSSWQGTRLVPRALDLPEEELLPLLCEAMREGVFSERFLEDLGTALRERRGAPAPAIEAASSDLQRVQAHFHGLIRSRAGEVIDQYKLVLPGLAAGVGTDEEPAWFPIDAMSGGFKYWWDAGAGQLRLMAESWSGLVSGSGQLHEITAAGARLLAEGFV